MGGVMNAYKHILRDIADPGVAFYVQVLVMWARLRIPISIFEDRVVLSIHRLKAELGIPPKADLGAGRQDECLRAGDLLREYWFVLAAYAVILERDVVVPASAGDDTRPIGLQMCPINCKSDYFGKFTYIAPSAADLETVKNAQFSSPFLLQLFGACSLK
jgi:hypothetical protein